MSVVPSPNANIRLEAPEEEPAFTEGSQLEIFSAPEGEDIPDIDDDGNILKIDHADGSVTVSLNGNLGSVLEPKPDKRWFDNLVEDIEESELSRIADDLLRGIEGDLTSRQQWIEDRAKGIRLLGLTLEQQGTGGDADGAPLEGMSKVRHPLLLEAVLRFQANARSELLPTDGPVKVRDDGNKTVERDSLADFLQRDMNHYLTSTAVEYYPDTDRMLLMLGFGGCGFKKVYQCPLRKRPVSESVDAEDLIVNTTAVSLETAERVTHRIYMKESTVKRMQIIGAYRDVDLSEPQAKTTDAVDDAKARQQGIDVDEQRPEDRPREIYEVYCELDVKGFEHKWKGKSSGLAVPYIVTIDKSSREILAVVRNYDKNTEELPEARKVFVQYLYIPGLGFYGIGLLHILGNTATALTAGWRETLDAGMFANFPGFLIAAQGRRQDTTQFRVPPGGGAAVDTGGAPIGDAIMPLPYKEAGPGFMAFLQQMTETGQRVGGTSELQVGEGRSDAPVGTTLALIEQALKVMNAVHKRMHTAQDQEFALLKECFKQNPESFWKANRRPATKWSQDIFMSAIEDYDLIPKADPNTASHSQRILKVMGLKQLQAASPDLYDPEKVDRAVLQVMGWAQPDQFFKSEEERSQMPPELIKGMADIEVAKQKADADTMRGQAALIKAGQPPAGMGVQPPEDKTAEHQLKAAELMQRAKEADQKHELATMQSERAARSDQAKMDLERERNQYDRIDDDIHARHQMDMERSKMLFERDADREKFQNEKAMEAIRLAGQLKLEKARGSNARKSKDN